MLLSASLNAFFSDSSRLLSAQISQANGGVWQTFTLNYPRPRIHWFSSFDANPVQCTSIGALATLITDPTVRSHKNAIYNMSPREVFVIPCLRHSMRIRKLLLDT